MPDPKIVLGVKHDDSSFSLRFFLLDRRLEITLVQRIDRQVAV